MEQGHKEEAVLILGSNIEPERHVPLALDLLADRFDLRAVSPAYRSAAVGGAKRHPPFVNVALRLRTDCPPRALREACRHVEARLGRRRSADRYAPRTLDLDVVLLGDRVEDHGGWRLPDPDFATQAFALVPAADVAPAFVHPVLLTTLTGLVNTLDAGKLSSLTRIADGVLADAVRITQVRAPAGDRAGPPSER